MAFKFAPILLLVVAISTGAVAVAQVEPAPSPAPSPTPNPMFHSPFNGDRRLSDPEGKDYTNLQQLYDFWQDDIAALAKIKKCGSAQDVAAAEALVERSAKAFEDALAQYVIDWSTFNYGTRTPPANGRFYLDAWNSRYASDKQAVLDLLQKNYKPFAPQTGDCPKPNKNMSPGPNGGGVKSDGSSRDRKDDDGLGGLLGHVTIGIDIGGRGHDHHGDTRKSDHQDTPPDGSQ